VVCVLCDFRYSFACGAGLFDWMKVAVRALVDWFPAVRVSDGPLGSLLRLMLDSLKIFLDGMLLSLLYLSVVVLLENLLRRLIPVDESLAELSRCSRVIRF
jgi:hypothetical protein